MNREQHPLDQFLKEKLSERSFAYQDKYWEAASEMIGHENRRRRGWIFWLLAGLMILPIGILGWSTLRLAPDYATMWADSSWESTFVFPDSCLMGSGAMVAVAEVQRPASEGQEVSSGSRRDLPSSLPARSTITDTLTSQELYQTLRKDQAILTTSLVEREVAITAMRLRGFQFLPFLLSPRVPKEAGDWKQFRHTLSLRVGSQLAPAWRGGAATQPGFSAMIGLDYRYALTPVIRLRTSLLYQQRAGLNRDTTFTSVQFGFGREEFSTTLENRSLHFVSVPIAMEMELGSRTGISLGIEPSYLIGIRTAVVESSSLDATNSDVSKTTWGYTQGYRRWDVSLQAGMHHYLGQGLRVGTTASYGLRDLTFNDYFRQGFTDRQINVRLWLNVDLPSFRSNNRRR